MTIEQKIKFFFLFFIFRILEICGFFFQVIFKKIPEIKFPVWISKIALKTQAILLGSMHNDVESIDGKNIDWVIFSAHFNFVRGTNECGNCPFGWIGAAKICSAHCACSFGFLKKFCLNKIQASNTLAHPICIPMSSAGTEWWIDRFRELPATK